jgi:hypothetical protein
MLKRLAIETAFAVCLLFLIVVAGVAQPEQEFAARPTWTPTSPERVADQLHLFLTTSRLPPDKQAGVREAWSDERTDSKPTELLDRLVAALAVADDRAAALVEHCNATDARGPLADFAWLADSEAPPLVRNNLRLYLARWLVQTGYYDEAISWMAGLKPADVIAPEALLFYRAVAHLRLVEPDQASTVLSELMTRRDELPVRYQKLADLMVRDLAALEDESLEHIARRMEDIRRRLALGGTGERVQKVEKSVIDSLDKLIKEAEDRQQRQQSAASGSSGQPNSAPQPMQDSRIAELKAPGKVESRDVGNGSGWGNLPEKEREKALQDIGRDFPSHYREVIEEYFRRMAAEESSGR